MIPEERAVSAATYKFKEGRTLLVPVRVPSPPLGHHDQRAWHCQMCPSRWLEDELGWCWRPGLAGHLPLPEPSGFWEVGPKRVCVGGGGVGGEDVLISSRKGELWAWWCKNIELKQFISISDREEENTCVLVAESELLFFPLSPQTLALTPGTGSAPPFQSWRSVEFQPPLTPTLLCLLVFVRPRSRNVVIPLKSQNNGMFLSLVGPCKYV